MRHKLADNLRKKGISDEALLAVLRDLPRHFFLDKAFEEHAYDDKPFPIGFEQTISQPYTVAYQTELLAIKKGDKVLEIGTGSGYQAAVLAALGARVYSVERQEGLFEKTRDLLLKLGFDTIRCVLGDGTYGLARFQPYQKIIVTAGAPVVPDALKQQLAIGGILVIPVGADLQKMHKITRTEANTWEDMILDDFKFVPFLQGIAPKKQ